MLEFRNFIGELKMTHDLYKNGDANIPDCVKDQNGDVVLGLCKRCGKAECELDEPCLPVNQDRELLELAAMAYGIQGMYRPGNKDIYQGIEHGEGLFQDIWCPLDDDGDDARLESALRFDVTWYESFVLVGPRICGSETGSAHAEYYADHNGDRQAARRYAGVRAAAEIGKGME